MPELDEVSRFLHETIEDAMTWHYVKYHPQDRRKIHFFPEGNPLGFALKCWTDIYKNHPLVIVRSQDPANVAPMMRSSLKTGLMYYVIAPTTLARAIEAAMDIQQPQYNIVFSLGSQMQFPIPPGVEVKMENPQTGGQKAVVFRGGTPVSTATTLWSNPKFCELSVNTKEKSRRQGFGTIALSALASKALGDGIKPLWIFEDRDEAARGLGKKVGFTDTGAREFACFGKLKKAT